MICPNCSLYISDPSTTICPRCGQSLSTSPGMEQGSEQFYNAPTFVTSQPPPATEPTPTSAQWMKPAIAPSYPQPVRKSSRKRRNIVAIAVIIIIVFACGVRIYSAFSGSGNPGTSNPLPGSNVIFSDPLSNDASGWSNDTDHCLFQNNAYHIKNSFVCFAPAGNIGDASITVQAKQVAGSLLEGYGISLRRVSSGNRYDFDIDGNSDWAFFKVVNNTATPLIDFTSNAAIKGGLNTINTLRVEAKGSHFTFFVNGTQVGEVDDTTYANGLVGLGASGTTTEVAYTDFEVDKVS